MTTADVLELLVDQYAAVPAPAPSRELAARMDAGWIGSVDDRGAVVVPFVPRPNVRVRVRYLVAALVATFVAMSGLAAAGALPDPVQRGVASFASHLGIDLPTPNTAPGSTPPGNLGAQPSPPHGSSAGGATTTSPVTGSGAPTASALPPSATTVPGGLGSVGNVAGSDTPTTVPPTTAPSTVPPLTVPPLTVPQLTLPPVTLPPITLGPITIQLPPLQLSL